MDESTEGAIRRELAYLRSLIAVLMDDMKATKELVAMLHEVGVLPPAECANEKCAKPFLRQKHRQRYCSPACSAAVQQRRFRAKKRANGVPRPPRPAPLLESSDV